LNGLEFEGKKLMFVKRVISWAYVKRNINGDWLESNSSAKWPVARRLDFREESKWIVFVFSSIWIVDFMGK
jgi:hypothetical protein